MKLIGLKRALILAVLLSVNLLFAAGYFLWVEPSRAQAEQDLKSINGAISGLYGKIDSIKAELAEFKKNEPLYQKLKNGGFFSEQERFGVSRDMERVRLLSGVKRFSFLIDDVKEVQDADAAAAEMRIIRSRIQVDKVVSLLDVDFYQLLDVMQSQFPTHVRVDNFELTRATALTPDALYRISAGETVPLVNAKGTFDWMTMVPIPPPAPPGQQGR